MADRSQLLNDAEEAMRLVLDGRLSSVWTSMPGIVQAVDLATMTVSVQLAIQGSIEDENGVKQSVNYPLLIHCPLVFPKGGGFVITFPIAIGDEVLVHFSARACDSWWQSGGIGRPVEARMHDLSDGFAMPGPFSVPNVPGSISSTGLQIRNLAGTQYIEFAADGKIKLVAAAGVEINGLPFGTHHHTGVTTGGGITGGPA